MEIHRFTLSITETTEYIQPAHGGKDFFKDIKNTRATICCPVFVYEKVCFLRKTTLPYVSILFGFLSVVPTLYAVFEIPETPMCICHHPYIAAIYTDNCQNNN